MGEQQSEMRFLKRDFFLSSKSFTQELDATPTSRQIEKVR